MSRTYAHVPAWVEAARLKTWQVEDWHDWQCEHNEKPPKRRPTLPCDIDEPGGGTRCRHRAKFEYSRQTFASWPSSKLDISRASVRDALRKAVVEWNTTGHTDPVVPEFWRRPWD